MDINANSVNKKLALIVFTAGLALTGCRTTGEDIKSIDSEALEDEGYLSRPKVILDTPVSTLPYTLNWEGTPNARSYEVQSALDIQFTEKRLSWTTRNDSFLLEELPSGESYIRIRSHFNGESSRWSEILKVDRKGRDITLERLRS
jgi:hypothetical protein